MPHLSIRKKAKEGKQRRERWKEKRKDMIQEKTREDVRDDKKGKGEKHRENKTRLQHTRENMSQSPV